MNKGRKPDIVCIGAQKAGTSWLHEMMATRPDVWVPPFKELHFFDHKFVEECRRWAPWHVRKGIRQAKERHLEHCSQQDCNYISYLNKLLEKPILNGTWYKFVFSRARPNQVCLDVTPEYSCIPDSGVEFFKRFLPEAKIVYIIRDPYDRMVSQTMMNVSRQKETPVTRNDWEEVLRHPALLTRGNYLEYIPRWDRHFSSDRLLYLPFGMIKSEPTEFLSRIETHCELSEFRYKQPQKRVHATERVRLPSYVLERLRKFTQPQQEYLVERFGEDFFAQTS